MREIEGKREKKRDRQRGREKEKKKRKRENAFETFLIAILEKKRYGEKESYREIENEFVIAFLQRKRDREVE